MTKNLRTPGPWEYWLTDEGYATTVCPQINITYRLTQNIGVDERAKNMALMEAEALANAQLIAAAPDLLEACKAALVHIEELEDAWRSGALSAHNGRDRARASRNAELRVLLDKAVAQAEGTEEVT